MNALIVDDDRFVVEALKEGLEWEQLGFQTINTAYNISQAKAVISGGHIDLLLCDIDMPHGSGLDLLTWLRGSSYDTLVIFLTNYASFDYAQKALALDSFHYVLKPVEFDKLTEIIRSAVKQIEKKNLQASVHAEYFWHSYLYGEITEQGAVLNAYFQQTHLPYTAEDVFLPVLFSLFPYELTGENALICRYSRTVQGLETMKAIFCTAFSDLLGPGDLMIEYNNSMPQFVAVFHLKSDEIPTSLPLDCETMQTLTQSRLCCPLRSYIGLPSHFSSFKLHFNMLRSMVLNCLDDKTGVFFLSQYRTPAEYYPAPDSKLLQFYLESAQYDAFFNWCSQYLHKLSAGSCLNSHSITGFQVDISQLIYGFLKEKNILANKLFHGDGYRILSSNARYSISYMEFYLRYILTVLQNYQETSVSEKTLVRSIVEYADQHYTDDITRDCLTEVFFLAPDYGSKLFKKETGVSFKNYIIQKRIDAAREMLHDTELPVNTIADKVGYGNYSYFTRLFKKVTGMTPVEYRNMYRGDSEKV